MAQENIEQINVIYQRINQKNNEEYEKRLTDIYAKYPELETIRKNLIELKVNIAKCNILNDIFNLKEYEKKIDEETKKYKKLLNASGLTDKDLEKHYDCDDCKDTGFINGKKCHCYIDKEIDIYRKISNFDNYKNILEKFSLNVYKQNEMSVEAKPYFEYMVNKFSNIKEMLLDFNKLNKAINIFISGKTGTGKTFLSRYIGQGLLNNHKTVIYITVNDLMNAVFKNMDKTNKKTEVILDYIEDCDMLIIDDLGKENINDFSIRHIYNLIDSRLNNKKSIIVCSSHIFSEINEIYGDGLTTRLYNYFYPIRLEGKDLRGIV